MSNRTLVELNHDYCPRESEMLDWARAMRVYMGSGAPSDLPRGVTFKHIRHHSDPDPLEQIASLTERYNIQVATNKNLVNQIRQQENNEAQIAALARANQPYRIIPLTRGLFSIVDAEDYERVAAHNWHARCIKGENRGFYAARSVGPHDDQRQNVMLHQFIIGDVPDGMMIDHANGAGLDNRRHNLRICTNSQNQGNRVPNRTSKYGYKGIAKDGNKWHAYIGQNGKQCYLGMHATKEEAARAYDRAALEQFGEFARLNFPDSRLLASQLEDAPHKPCTHDALKWGRKKEVIGGKEITVCGRCREEIEDEEGVSRLLSPRGPECVSQCQGTHAYGCPHDGEVIASEDEKRG